MENNYTIVVWRVSDKLPDVMFGRGADALDALTRLVDDGMLEAVRTDLRLVAVVSGMLHPSATVVELAARPRDSLGGAREEEFTVIGFWQNSGETFMRVERASSGVQALRLAAARAASPNRGGQELQVVLAFPGKHNALVTRETVPNFW